jgi:molybdate transport system ATP-binding protein
LLDLRVDTGLRSLRLDVELAVEAGRTLAVVGPSGAGKTSILRAASGLLRPERGAISCGGTAWLDTGTGVDLPPEDRRCGYVFQDYALFGHMSAWRNVAYGLGHLPRRDRRARAMELLEAFGLARHADARPPTLSGGERQRLALARALGSRPRALLLDEPLSALDATTRAGAVRVLRRLSEAAAVPTLLVTHDFEEAGALAEEVAVIESGRIVQRGTPDVLAAEPASAFVADLTGSVVLTGHANAGPGGVVEVALDGGGTATSAGGGPVTGPVAVAVHPWEIALEPVSADVAGSPRNRLPATVRSVTTIGNRVRVGMDAGQPLVAEVTPAARDELGLRPGAGVTAVWKASATRIVSRGDG